MLVSSLQRWHTQALPLPPGKDDEMFVIFCTRYGSEPGVFHDDYMIRETEEAGRFGRAEKALRHAGAIG